MDLGLTYRHDATGPGVFLSFFDLGPTPTTITRLEACWTRDAAFAGSSFLDYEAVVYAYEPAGNGPGALLAQVSGRATSVPISSDGGRQGANCRFYHVPLRVRAQGRVLAGIRFVPRRYPSPGVFAGYLLGVDSDATLTKGWFLDNDRWQRVHDSSFLKGLGYRAFMIRLEHGEDPAPEEPPPPPAEIPFLQTSAVPDFRFKVRIGGSTAGRRESDCILETLCVSGALPDRSELFLRVIGPRPNGHLWLNLVRFSPAEIEVWAEQRSTGAINYYRLPALPPSNEDLRGLVDRTAFRPSSGPRRTTGPEDHSASIEEGTPLSAEKASFRPPEFPDYRFTVRIFSGGVEQPTRREASCIPETVCISGSIPGRSEAFLRIIGPRPNGFFHVNLVRFTPSRVDITIERLSTGETRRYVLPELAGTSSVLTGRLDRNAFSAGGEVLPPDPGPENDRTLEGIDADGDGLRDDVQRFIQLEYGNDPDTVSALRQGAEALLDGLEDSAANSPVIDDAEAAMRALECAMAVRPADGHDTFLALAAEVIDTERRLREWIDYGAALNGQVLKVTAPDLWVTSCGFAPRSLRLRRMLETIHEKGGVCSDTSEAVVYFINGVFNFPGGAETSATELASRLLDPASPLVDVELEVELLYNQTLFTLDLYEAVRQRAQLGVSRFFRILGGLEVMPDFFADAYLSLAEVADAAAVVTAPALLGHVQTYRRQLAEGKKVVVVPHSQGNFFANQAWGLLSSQERASFGIVSVANPDSTVADGRGRWTTHHGDLVIAVIPGSLPSNVGGPVGDLLGHALVDTYLRPESSAEARILSHVRQTIDALEEPDGEVSDGIVTVTLTWGSEPDVDLHVFEPSGEHVFYADPVGRAGFLDRDDVTGFGPEHYFVSCDTLEAGTYRVGVNYYRGFFTETAQIEIDAGPLNRKMTRVLTTVRGPLGDSSPIPVGRLVVTGNRQTGFSFQVIED